MFDSLRPHGLSPTRLLQPRNSPGKNTRVGCHFLLQLYGKRIIHVNCPDNFLILYYYNKILSIMITMLFVTFTLYMKFFPLTSTSSHFSLPQLLCYCSFHFFRLSWHVSDIRNYFSFST